jgi:hypothetical protein
MGTGNGDLMLAPVTMVPSTEIMPMERLLRQRMGRTNRLAACDQVSSAAGSS